MKFNELFKMNVKDKRKLENIYADYFATNIMSIALIGLLIYNSFTGKSVLELLILVAVYISAGEFFKHKQRNNLIPLLICIISLIFAGVLLIKHLGL